MLDTDSSDAFISTNTASRASAMPQSLSNILVHLVFSTKDRAPLLDADIGPGLHAYLATVARGIGCECHRAGGVSDHVHLAIRLSRTVTVAALG